MRKIFLLILCLQMTTHAERRGRLREFFRSPFQQSGNPRQPSLDYIPIVNSRNERTIAINGIAVPSNAIGYRIRNGVISWVFRDGTESPSGEIESQTPVQTISQGPRTHGETVPPASEERKAPRPIESAGDQRPRGSTRRAPSLAEQKNGGTTPSQDGQRAFSDVFPSGVNGNPGFPYKVLGPGFSEKCQATLISNEEGLCMAATAAHCLYDGANRSNDKGFDGSTLSQAQCDSQVSQKGFFWGKGEIETANFGKVEATFFINPEYYSGTKSEDSAVFSFPCKKQENVKSISVSSNPLQDGEQVYYGKVMGGKEGLYEGRIYREPNIVKINSRNIGEAQESVNQPSSVTIQQGDSGGGLYRKNSAGELELVGVLSTSDDVTKRRPIGNYATNRSLEFIQCIQRAFRNK